MGLHASLHVCCGNRNDYIDSRNYSIDIENVAKFHFYRNLRSLEFCIRVIHLPMLILHWVLLVTQICRIDWQKEPWFKSVFMHHYIMDYRKNLSLNFHRQNSVISIGINTIENIISPCKFCIGFSWSREFSTWSDRKILGLKVTSCITTLCDRTFTVFILEK